MANHVDSETSPMIRRLLMASLVMGTLASATMMARESGRRAIKRAGDYEVRVVRDLAYYDGEDADPKKHRLALYLPRGKTGFPVLLFVHGGGWRNGDKKYLFDVYGRIGRAFARNGIGTVVTNYRLSPKVKHPAHVQDVAKAFAWTKRHIAEYGGRADQIFLCGHSAGGHLVALLATDPRYLKAEKLSLGDICGVVAVSGVYRIPPGRLFRSAFGEDAKGRRDASPIQHVHGHHPPFLILYAERDFPTCDRVSREFCAALQKVGCSAKCNEIADRDHITIITWFSRESDDAFQAALQFIADRAGLQLAEVKTADSSKAK